MNNYNLNISINIRKICFEILISVFLYKKHSSFLLNDIFKINYNFKKNDKSLIFNIVYGTIKNKIYLEYIINKFINNKKTDLKLQIILWMSLYQIYFLKKIPIYAIVNESVNIIKFFIKDNKKVGFINAVLNKISISDKNIFDINCKNKIYKKLIKYSFPKKLYFLIKKQYNEKIANLILKDSIKIPKISFRVNILKNTREFFLKKYNNFNFIPSKISKNGLISNIPIIDFDFFKNGEIYIQDEMSMYVVEILDPKPNEIVLDMCAGPGGKLIYISELMKNTGFIDAYEINKNKVNLIYENINRMNNIKNIRIYNSDSTKIKNNKKYDKILLDPPCLGFGVIKRKPEIKYFNFFKNKIFDLVKLQYNLLKIAFNKLKKNGILVYSTCTFEINSNSKQIINFIKNYSNMKIIFEKQFFGYEKNTDGFYICKMLKLK